MIYRISHPTKVIKTVIQLPASKSLSNRALIIQALAPASFKINNLSKAADTALLKKLLHSNDDVLDCKDAGTTLRFIVAYMALQGRDKIITGSERMKQRPVGELVHALNALGAKISSIKREGYPPLKIEKSIPSGGNIKIDGSISSQFISALLMIAPCLKNGLGIELTGEVISKPYIDMTLSLMDYFGIQSDYHGNHIRIKQREYISKDYTCEADWSAASYWYEIAALSVKAEITLTDLPLKSLQGDAVISKLMHELGVHTNVIKKDIHLVKDKTPPASFFEYNFIDCPDIAQTLACTCAAMNVSADLKGLQSLRIKETNRAVALQRELYNVSIQTDFCDYSKLKIYNYRPIRNTKRVLQTHHDHRMAMALAPLALKLDYVDIENPEVVRKSYPGYWDDLKRAGFEIEVFE